MRGGSVGRPRNLWRWWPTWVPDLDKASLRLEEGCVRDGMRSSACVQAGCGWAGTAMFTLLRGFNGAGVN